MEFPCNINVLIASEGRSLLPVRTKVKMWSGRPDSPSTPAPELPGRGHVSCPRSWADCRWRLSPASVALLLVGLPQTLWPPASRRIANSRRNAPCAIPVYWSNGLPWQHLCATGTVLGLVHSSYFQWRQHCKQPGAIRSQRTSVFTLEHWLEASTPRWSGPTLKCQTCIETNPVENSFCPLIVSLSAGPSTRFILIESVSRVYTHFTLVSLLTLLISFCLFPPNNPAVLLSLAFHSDHVISVTPQSDCQIHLQSQVSQAQVEEYLSSIHVHPQVSSQLNKFRIYLSMARQLDYSISNEMTKVRLTPWYHYPQK